MVHRCPLVLLTLLFLSLFPLFAGGYAEEVYTSLTFGPGYESGDSLFFLLTHKLYQPARGILAFPDGGISRTLTEGLYLLEYRAGTLSVQGYLPKILPGPGAVKGAAGFLREGGLDFYLPRGIPGEYRKIRWENGSLVVNTPGVPLPPGDPLVKAAPSDFSRDLFLEGYPLPGLPSPAEEAGKKRRGYFHDVVELRGDIYYRRAVIREAGFSREELESLLSSMDRRAHRLEGYKADAYRFSSEETRAAVLKELTGYE